jgi:hypothetical protein
MKIGKKFNEVAVKTAAMPTDSEAARQILDQYRTVVESEKTCFKERVKFGAMLIQWEQYLGDGAGRGHEGEGLKGWLEKNCPAIAYVTAQSYKTMAERVIKMIGGGRMAEAALLEHETVVQPDGEAVDIDSAMIQARDSLFANVDSRRKLEQAWFDFMKTTGGERVAPRREIKKLSRQEESKVIWTGVMNILDKSAVLDAVPLLPGDVAEVCLERVTAIRDALKRRVAEEV